MTAAGTHIDMQQIRSAGTQPPARPRGLTGCAFNLRHGESLPFEKELLPPFVPLCADLLGFFSFLITALQGWVRLLGVGTVLHVCPGERRHGARARSQGTQPLRSDEEELPIHSEDQGGSTGAGQLESLVSLFLPARRRADGKTARGAAAFAASDVLGHETRQEKALGSQTSADPGLAEVCAAASAGFGPGPGEGMSNVRPKHSAEERKHCGRRGRGCGTKRKRGGGTSKAGRVDPLPPLQSHAQQGTEARQLRQGEWQREVLFFSLWCQSLPLGRRRPFETLHLASSHLGAG